VISVVNPQRTASGLKIVDDATCTFCGCMCDDITLTVEGNRITDAANACTLGESWFLSHRGDEGPECVIAGQPAALEEGIERAARILHDASYPIICGLAGTTSEAQRAAVSLGDCLGACVDPTTSASEASSMIAFQEVGEVTCTLGEIKNRGDLIIIWGADPAESHPRHFNRYSLTANGTFVPHGRGDRYCVVVDVSRTRSALEADLFIAIKAQQDFEALWTLRAIAKGIELDPALVESATGAPLTTWQGLIDRFKQATYGVILFGTELTSGPGAHLNSHALLALVRDMNAHTRFVCMPMGGRGSLTGAENVMAWQTGYPCAVNLARGYPRFDPGEYTATHVLERGEADAVLTIGGDSNSQFTEAVRQHVERVPSIVLDAGDSATSRTATVVFRTATDGLHTSGTVYRVDGVALPLRAALSSRLPSVFQVLRAVEQRVRRLQSAENS
jgi:formylmethanofuran dehydrogenase subunit B